MSNLMILEFHYCGKGRGGEEVRCEMGDMRCARREIKEENSHNPRRNSIHSDPFTGDLLRQTSRKRCDRSFSRGIIKQRRVTHVRRDRSAIHNGISALHVFEGEFGHGEHGNDVCLERHFRHVEIDLCDIFAHFLHGGWGGCVNFFLLRDEANLENKEEKKAHHYSPTHSTSQIPLHVCQPPPRNSFSPANPIVTSDTYAPPPLPFS